MKDTHSEKLLPRWECQKGLYSELWKGLEKRVPTPVGQSLEDQEVLTKQEDQFIKLTSLCNKKATAGDIQLTINNTREQPISKATVRRKLAACGLEEEWHVQNHFCILPISARGIYGQKKIQKTTPWKTGKKYFSLTNHNLQFTEIIVDFTLEEDMEKDC